jgi:hypothetical protein
VRGDDQAAFDPWFARTIGADEFGHRFDGRFHRHHVDPDTREMSAAQRGSQRVDVHDRSARGVHHHCVLRQQREFRRADQPARLRRQRRMHRQRVGGAQQRLQRRRAADAQPEFHAVRQMRIEEHHAEAERLGAQRDRGADASHADDAEGLHRGAPHQRVQHVAPCRRRVLALQFVVQQQAAAQCECQRDGVVGDLGRAVIGHVQHHDLAVGCGAAVDHVVADAHAAHRAQPGEPRQIVGGHVVAPYHQALGRSAIGVRQVGERRRGTGKDHPHVRAVDAPFDAVIRVVVFRVQHCDRHRSSSH